MINPTKLTAPNQIKPVFISSLFSPNMAIAAVKGNIPSIVDPINLQ